MRLLVCGSRKWQDKEAIFTILDLFKASLNKEELIIIEGQCYGADLIAEEWAISRNVPFEGKPAEWSKYGKAAGMIRNKEMLESCPDFVLAFTDSFTGGTKNMVNLAKKKNILTKVYTQEECRNFLTNHL